jgi:hypothetical protein
MSFDDLFRKDRPNKMLQRNPSRLVGGDGPQAWSWAAAIGVFWGLSYFFWGRLQATPMSA